MPGDPVVPSSGGVLGLHRPETICTREEWDAALAAGSLTIDDAIERLRRIAVREFGQIGPVGYDEDGFITALVAEGVRIEGGVRLVVHTRDHQPPHVHVQRVDAPDVVVQLVTGEVLREPPGVRAKDLRGFQRAVMEIHQTELRGFWEKAHGPIGDPGDWPELVCTIG